MDQTWIMIGNGLHNKKAQFDALIYLIKNKENKRN